MKPSQRHLCVLILLLSLLAGLSSACDSSASERGITIATAASSRFAMEAFAQNFTQRTNIPTTVISGSSGKLTAQIRAGAPFDFFLSANKLYPEVLREGGFTLNAPEIFASGSLILWTKEEAPPQNLAAFLLSSTGKVAIANPNTAPYGIAAMEVIGNLGLDSALADRLVYGESIAQVNQFLTSGAAEMGFTALSAMPADQTNTLVNYAFINDSLYSPIVHSGVIIKHGNKQTAAMAISFGSYLKSAEARKIWHSFGYRMSD